MVRAGKIGTSYRRQVRQKVQRSLPKVTYGVLVESGTPPVRTYHAGLAAVPADLYKNYRRTGRKLLRQDAVTTVKEIKKFHRKTCTSRGTPEQFARDCKEVDLHVDGARETMSSPRNLVFVTLRFGKCLYLAKALNPLMSDENAKPDPDFMVGDILQEIEEDPELQLVNVLGDMPARLQLKGMMSHAGRYSCETCTVAAATRPGMHWPFASSTDSPLRTDQEIRTAAG